MTMMSKGKSSKSIYRSSSVFTFDMCVVLSFITRLHTLADTRSPTVESKVRKFKPSDNHD